MSSYDELRKRTLEQQAAAEAPAPAEIASETPPAPPANPVKTPAPKREKKVLSKGLSNYSSDGIIGAEGNETPKQSGKAGLPLAKDTMLELMKKQSETEPTIRLNVDVTQTMHKRIKMFCVAHDVKSIREMVTVVLDDYLKQHGF